MREETLDDIIEKDKTEFAYAGFGKRYAAVMIDTVLIAWIATYAVKNMIHENITLSNLISGEGYEGGFYGELEVQNFITYILFMMLFRWLYFAGMESSPFKATAGKLLVGLYVENTEGGRVTFLKATGRYFGKILSGLILYIGYLMMLGSPTKQTLHDQMSGCVVKEK